MAVDSSKSKRKRRGLVAIILNWWRRKRTFYHAHEDNSHDSDCSIANKSTLTLEDRGSPEELECDASFTPVYTPTQPVLISPPSSPAAAERHSTDSTNEDEVMDSSGDSLLPPIPAHTYHTPQRAYPLSRIRTADDSFMGSLESMDSLVESYWDPDGDDDDDESHVIPIATNALKMQDFLNEHVDFLREKTQLRSVQVVWNNNISRETGQAAQLAI